MKLKKVIVTFLLTILSLYSISLINSVNAAILNPGKDLTITEFREDGYGHRVLEKNVWEIVETSSPTGGTIDHSSTIYCLKGGPGFGSADYSTAVKTYTRYFNMKDSTFINSNDAYRNALPTNSNTYKALLWVLEHAYLPPSEAASSTDKQEAQEYKEKLLTQAGVDIDYLTDDDIDVVQQLAIWHFTNMGDDNYDVGEEGNFDMAVNVDVNDNSNYISLSDEFYWSTTGRYRQEDAQSLYLYLINTATEAVADGYEPQTVTQPYELANLTQTLQESGSNYIIGPFRIEAQEGAEGTIEGEFTDGIGNPINNYTLRSSNGSSYTTYNSFEDTV